MNELKTLTLQQKYNVILCASNSHMRYTNKKAINYMLLGYLGFDINQSDTKEYLNMNDIIVDYTNFNEMNSKWCFVNNYNYLFTIIAALKEDINNKEAYEAFYDYLIRIIKFSIRHKHMYINSMIDDIEDIVMQCIIEMIKYNFIGQCNFTRPYAIYSYMKSWIWRQIKTGACDSNKLYVPRHTYNYSLKIYTYIKKEYPELIYIKDKKTYLRPVSKEIREDVIYNLNVTEEQFQFYIDNNIFNVIDEHLKSVYGGAKNISSYEIDEDKNDIIMDFHGDNHNNCELEIINNSLIETLTPIEQFAVESYYRNNNGYLQIVDNLNTKYSTDKYNYQNVQKMIKRAILKMRKQAKILYPDMNIDELISA